MLSMRSLTIFRVGIGVYFLCDVFSKVPHFEDFYGIGCPTTMNLSSEASLGLRILLALQCVASVGLVVNSHPSVASVAIYACSCILRETNFDIHQACDPQMRALLLWFILILAYRPVRGGSVAELGFSIQVATMYIFAVMLKSPLSYFVNADAVYMVLQLDHYASSWGEYMFEMYGTEPWFKTLTCILTRATFFTEFVGGFLIAFPSIWGSHHTARVRTVTHITFIALHVGIMFSMDLGPFSLSMILMHITCLPSEFWGEQHQRDNMNHGLMQRAFANACSLLLLVFIICSNLNSMAELGEDATVTAPWAGKLYSSPITKPLMWIENNLSLRQKWNMFLFHRRTHRGNNHVFTGHHDFIGELQSGARVDLVSGNMYDDEKRVMWLAYESRRNMAYRQRQRLANLHFAYNDTNHNVARARWFCHKRNVLEPWLEPIIRVDVKWVAYHVQFPYESIPDGAPTRENPQSKTLIHGYPCL